MVYRNGLCTSPWVMENCAMQNVTPAFPNLSLLHNLLQPMEFVGSNGIRFRFSSSIRWGVQHFALSAVESVVLAIE